MEEQVAKRESPFKIIYGFAEEKRGKLTLATVLAVFGALCGIVPYLAVASLLQHALTGSLDVRAALGLAALAVLGYVFQKGLSARATLSAHEAAYEIIAHVRVRMLQKLSRVSMGTVQARSSGAYKQLIIDDAERLEIPLAHIIPEVTAAIATPLFVLAYLVIIDWRMALAALASGILGLAVYYCMMFGRNKMMQDYLASNMHMNATIVEYVNGIEVVRAFGQSASRMERLKDAVLRVRDITTKWYAHCWPFMSAGQAIMPQTIVFVLPVGMALYAAGIVSLDETILCMLLAMAIVSSLQTMMEFMENLSVVMEVVPQVQAVLALPELPLPSESQRPQHSDVVLEDVHFSYEAGRETIHGVSLTAPAGSVTALVGPSGSGKSTLARLIARYWDVAQGAVKIGGVDVRQMSLDVLNDQISYVSQENFLFNRSLRENIRIGRPTATDAEVEWAATQAGCDSFIARFPAGYDTNAGDAGARLSGGERQRLALARALLKDAPIVILDEATAFTDPENEDKLQRAIDALTKDKTLIVIAHRLQTIMHADQILVLKDGAVSARGTHEELLVKSEIYRAMWQTHVHAMDWQIVEKATAKGQRAQREGEQC